uniref:Beta/gamma crystallin 'Greek key' domain-containing protein n=1 Tax=Leptobrachium leishanense TaxID=445787 RepID=A0A8C5P5Z5_9ANUR
MSSLNLFPEKNMKGNGVCLRENTPHLADKGFCNQAMSLQIVGRDPWVVFDLKNYGGDFNCYEGDHHSIPNIQKQISSAKIMRGGLEDPKLIIYQGENCTGRSITVDEEKKHFDGYDFPGKAASAEAVSGSWILYEEKNLRGKKRIIIAGERTPGKCDTGDCGWKGGFLSAEPITRRFLVNE